MGRAAWLGRERGRQRLPDPALTAPLTLSEGEGGGGGGYVHRALVIGVCILYVCTSELHEEGTCDG